MNSFANLKRSSGSIEKLSKAIENIGSKEKQSDDDRFWTPTADKAGNGMAVIRFLPAPAVDGDDGLPWVRIFHHGFQGPGGWLIDNCPTTINETCPVCEHNSTLWNSGIEANKNIAREQKRKLSYISNIYIISDPKNPDNEGKVMLYKYGQKIFDKIQEAMQPQFEDETPIPVFDFWKGANFKLKFTGLKRDRSYEKSAFEDPSPLFDDDDEMEAIWKKEYSLQELISKSKFKSYDKLKERLDKVLGSAKVKRDESFDEENEESFEMEETSSKSVRQPVVTTKASSSGKSVDLPEDDDEESLDFFKSLVDD